MPNKYLDVLDELTFSMFKGYTLLQIFKYAPDFITWLIERTDKYYVDISQFESLPTPTPYPYKTEMVMPSGAIIEAIPKGVNNIPNALIFEDSGGIIATMRFLFSDKIKDINERKKNGEVYKYVSPYVIFNPKRTTK